MFNELFEEYGQFIIMLLVFLIGGGVYAGYLYYQKQETINKVNDNLQKQPISPPPIPKQQLPKQPQQQAPDFVPADSFKGKQVGYVFKKGDKGTGYYKEK